jgi:tetratricopeptide (TPR) repeat protein
VFLKEAVSLVPRYAIARKALASCYTKQGNLRDALEELEAAQKCAPDDVSICVSLAECYRAAGMADSAIHQYEKALLIEPQGAAVRLDLGFLYLAVRDYERAADSLEKVIALNDGAASARAPLAHAYLERGKLLDAALQCRDYVMLRGANADIARALASDIESRLRDLHDETGTGVADRTRFVLAQVFAALNEADRAVAHLEQIDGTKHGILFRQMVAQALAQQGKVREQPVQGTLDGR